MYARVVRFTGVTQEGIDNVLAEIEESDGPPPGVDATGMKMLYDSGQQTSLFVAFFETAEAMAEADASSVRWIAATPRESAPPSTTARCVIEREA